MTAGRGGNTAGGPARHVPVMLPDVLEALAPREGGTYVDGTFGGGGYTTALLQAADCAVIAIDRDPAAISAGAAMVADFAPRLSLIEGRFGDMLELLGERGVVSVDGLTLDVGVSSRQIDEAGRGFSFQSDGPLDMRMGATGPTAADVVNRLSEADLARTIAVYGEERRARAVARAICAARRERPLARTGELASVVARATGGRWSRIHPATRTFQAIRILVNAELDELSSGLVAAERLLRDGGRLAIVSFHSLEDRIVKRFLGARMGRDRSVSRYRPEAADGPQPSFRAVGALLRKPADSEIDANPRARSARLRVAERTAAAPWPLSSAPLNVIPATPFLESLA